MHWSAAHNGYVEVGGLLRPPSTPVRLAWRALAFLLVFAALSIAWTAARDSSFASAVVHQGTVRPAAWIINLLTPAAQARAVDSTIRAPGGGINILNGCEGLDALFLLIAAFCAAPLSPRTRAAGLLIGLVVVFAVNQARILALFYAYRAEPALFQPLHGTVLPIAVVLLVSGYFHAWLRVAERVPARPR